MRRPELAIFDGFFTNFEEVYQDIVAGEFKDFASPWDAVTYPGINQEISPWIKKLFHVKLSQILDAEIEDVATFARMTTETTAPAPHAIHSDAGMAQFSAHVYLSKDWPVNAGTSFWAHLLDGTRHTPETNIERVRADSHRSDAWRHSATVQGHANRALIHAAGLWHRAEPFGGWGKDQHDGRLVLTCFFNHKETV